MQSSCLLKYFQCYSAEILYFVVKVSFWFLQTAHVRSLPSDYVDVQDQSYDPNYISDISKRMQVPERICVDDGSGAAEITGYKYYDPGSSRQFSAMNVPDRIILAGTVGLFTVSETDHWLIHAFHSVTFTFSGSLVSAVFRGKHHNQSLTASAIAVSEVTTRMWIATAVLILDCHHIHSRDTLKHCVK